MSRTVPTPASFSVSPSTWPVTVVSSPEGSQAACGAAVVAVGTTVVVAARNVFDVVATVVVVVTVVVVTTSVATAWLASSSAGATIPMTTTAVTHAPACAPRGQRRKLRHIRRGRPGMSVCGLTIGCGLLVGGCLISGRRHLMRVEP